jgi:hypothetical protein
MDRSYVVENKLSRERLGKLVKVIKDEELTLTLYAEGWTVAAALAHLAFWDQRRLLLVRKWKKNGITPSPIDEDLINDTLVPFFLALPPRKTAGLSLSVAQELDRELEALPAGLVEEINKLGDRHALNRGIHRKMHLDDIEKRLSL